MENNYENFYQTRLLSSRLRQNSSLFYQINNNNPHHIPTISDSRIITTTRPQFSFDFDFFNNFPILISRIFNEINLDFDIEYEMFNELENEKIVITSDEFEKKINIINDKENCECGICKENYNENESIGVELIKCKHVFCKQCIYEWLTKYNVNCPICRKDVRTE